MHAPARRLPSGLKAMVSTPVEVAGGSDWTSMPVAVSQTFTSPPGSVVLLPADVPHADASFVPSGLNDTVTTRLVWPLSLCSTLPVAASHRMTNLSELPDASRLPSGLKTT